MNLIDVYNALQRKDITEEQAAQAFGITVTDLRFRTTRWGHRLPLLLSVLDKIKADTISRAEAAKVLGISGRQVNKLQESWKTQRKLKQYLVDRTVSKIKWEMHKKYAIDVIAGSMEFEEAAENTGLSTRQMRREVSKLLEKHYEMPYKDLKTLSLTRRKRLADEIETAENLEISKQQVLKSIADGKLSMQEEALKRVLSKRTMQNRGA